MTQVLLAKFLPSPVSPPTSIPGLSRLANVGSSKQWSPTVKSRHEPRMCHLLHHSEIAGQMTTSDNHLRKIDSRIIQACKLGIIQAMVPSEKSRHAHRIGYPSMVGKVTSSDSQPSKLDSGSSKLADSESSKQRLQRSDARDLDGDLARSARDGEAESRRKDKDRQEAGRLEIGK